MNTKYFLVDKNNPDTAVLREAADILKSGGLVAFPTETVYGLGANGLDGTAVGKIFAAKGRPSDNPLILHISSADELERLTKKITPQTWALVQKFWPGPLTVVLEKSAEVPDIVTGGLNTVAVRMPDSKTARELIRLAEVPLAAPSANTSGRPSPTNAQAVLDDLDGRIDAVIDAGASGIGLESTVVDLSGDVPRVLRPGSITAEMLTAVLGQVEFDAGISQKDNRDAPKAPGMKYTHYAPKYPMILVSGDILREQVEKALAERKKVGAIVSAETQKILPSEVVAAVYGSRADLNSIAAGLYEALRHFDKHAVDIIFAESVERAGLGAAIMNRLAKAAYEIIEYN